MKSHIFKKNYIAVVNGYFDKKIGTINAPISRKENSIIERCVNDLGDKAVTNYYVIRELPNNTSIVYINLETGRTHQIRVHMSYIGHSIVGDSLYGVKSNTINRQALHAYKVTFIHPITKEIMNIEAEIPHDIEKIISI